MAFTLLGFIVTVVEVQVAKANPDAGAYLRRMEYGAPIDVLALNFGPAIVLSLAALVASFLLEHAQRPLARVARVAAAVAILVPVLLGLGGI